MASFSGEGLEEDLGGVEGGCSSWLDEVGEGAKLLVSSGRDLADVDGL